MSKVNLVCSELLLLPVGKSVLLRFSLAGTYNKWGGTRKPINLSCSNKAVTLSTTHVEIEEGWFFLTHIHSTAAGAGIVAVEFDGKADGTITFSFLTSKDVFDEVAHKLLIDELTYVAKEVNDENHVAEYSGNYCMSAAERGLSELLLDITNFLAVERNTHKHKNSVGFMGKTAIDRGKRFEALGFTAAAHEFDSYTIDHKKKDLIYKAKDDTEATAKYNEVKYDIVGLSAAAKAALNKFFEDDLKGKEIGFHVYYMTVTNGFHTLLLIIDKWTSPCSPTYEIWDQHGKSTSFGALADLADGILRQTSWTFANSCLNRYKAKTTKFFDSTKTYLWKIQKK